MEQEELNFERKQFTFYRSFLKSIRRIGNMQERGEVYDAVCDYALNRTEPDYDSMTPIQLAVMDLVTPVLDSARKKALSGKKHGKEYGEQTGNKQGTNREQTRNKREIEIKKEIEIDKEIEIETETETEIKGESLAGGGGFDIFWNYFPKKVGKESARAVFEQVSVPLPVLLNAIRKQKQSIQWNRENGRYIPNAATWLSEQRWEDDLPAPSRTGAEVKASGELGNTERSALSQMLGM